MENIIREMIEKAIYYKETIRSIDEAYELIRFTRDLIPLTCATLATIGRYFKSRQKNTNNNK